MQKETPAQGRGWQALDNSLDTSSLKPNQPPRQAVESLFQEAGFAVSRHNNGTHLVLRGRGLKIDFWPTAGKFMVWGRVVRSTPEAVMAAATAGQFRPPESKSLCKRCHAQIYWIKSARDRWQPLDSDGGAHLAHCRKTQ